MSYLSEELKQYYKRVNNKILFTSGKSLNQFAFDLWEKMDYKSVDASLISRVINSKRLFNYHQLEAFCKLLRLDNSAKKKLFKSMLKDIINRHSLTDVHDRLFKENNPENLDSKLIHRMTSSLHILREEGYPNDVIDLAHLYRQIINDRLSTTLTRNEKNYLTTLTLVEEARAYGETLSNPYACLQMNKINLRTTLLLNESKDQEINDMVHMNVGGLLYLQTKWNSSISYLTRHYSRLQQHNKLDFLRTLILNYTFSNDFTNFKRTLIQSTSLIEKCINSRSRDTDSKIASFLEATARSLTMFGYIKDAKKILDSAIKMDIPPFFKSQIHRCYFFNAFYDYYQNNKIDKEYLKDSYSKFSHRFSAYSRHIKQVKRILKKMKIIL